MKRHDPADLSAQLVERLAIDELNASFCHCLDTQQYDELANLLTADVHYCSGPQILENAQAVITFFKRRAAQTTPRTTRHMQSGLRLAFSTDGVCAKGLSVVICYAAHAPAPVDQITPFMVADFADVYRRGNDGSWRIKERVITPVFRNPEMAPKALTAP